MATLTYIFQAAMGQCSTLPGGDGERLVRENGRKESLDFSNIEHREPPPESMRMQITPYREAAVSVPETAIRTRCYKLNLDCKQRSSSTIQGPYAECQPYLTYSSSTDDSTGSPITVAIQTAQLFRGIRVDSNGIIISQNARATRSSRGKVSKRGEKSRQASKIDKAIEGESNELVSLIPIGEYDDMKQLVRDGSRKLREASGMPDTALLAQNRYRKYPLSSGGAPRPLKQHPRDSVPKRSKSKTMHPGDEQEDFAWNLWNCGVESRTYQRRVG